MNVFFSSHPTFFPCIKYSNAEPGKQHTYENFTWNNNNKFLVTHYDLFIEWKFWNSFPTSARFSSQSLPPVWWLMALTWFLFESATTKIICNNIARLWRKSSMKFVWWDDLFTVHAFSQFSWKERKVFLLVPTMCRARAMVLFLSLVCTDSVYIFSTKALHNTLFMARHVNIVYSLDARDDTDDVNEEKLPDARVF